MARNSPLSTSFRSVIQATLSARSGWIAKMAAATRLLPIDPVSRVSAANRKATAAAWSTALCRW